jgi:hypothetical protein
MALGVYEKEVLSKTDEMKFISGFLGTGVPIENAAQKSSKFISRILIYRVVDICHWVKLGCPLVEREYRRGKIELPRVVSFFLSLRYTNC